MTDQPQPETTCPTCAALRDELENVRECLLESPDLEQKRDDVLLFVEVLLARFNDSAF